MIWGLAESTVFFIVPDVGVAFIALMSPRDWWKAALTSILGTLLGAVILFLAIHFWLHDRARDYLVLIPAIHPSTLASVSARISAHGPAALLTAAIEGIPYKVFATQLTIAGVSLPVLLFWTIPSRALRLLPVAGAAGIGGRVLAGFIERFFRFFVATYAFCWLVGYGWYWTR